MSTIIGDFIRAIFDFIGGVKPYAQLSAELDAKQADGHQHLNWRESIVDLMKLTGQDSSLDARARLARELGHDGPFTGTAEQNVWLHARVIEKLERQ